MLFLERLQHSCVQIICGVEITGQPVGWIAEKIIWMMAQIIRAHRFLLRLLSRQ